MDEMRPNEKPLWNKHQSLIDCDLKQPKNGKVPTSNQSILPYGQGSLLFFSLLSS